MDDFYVWLYLSALILVVRGHDIANSFISKKAHDIVNIF